MSFEDDIYYQYRPVSNRETNVDDGLSVRAVHDTVAGINNYLKYAGRHQVIFEARPDHWESKDTNTDECVIAMFAPRMIPTQFSSIHYYLGHYRSAGSSNTIWNLYITPSLYKGPEKFDVKYISGSYGQTNFITSNTDHSITTSSDLNIPIYFGDRKFFFLLTAKNLDSSTISKVSTINLIPKKN